MKRRVLLGWTLFLAGCGGEAPPAWLVEVQQQGAEIVSARGQTGADGRARLVMVWLDGKGLVVGEPAVCVRARGIARIVVSRHPDGATLDSVGVGFITGLIGEVPDPVAYTHEAWWFTPTAVETQRPCPRLMEGWADSIGVGRLVGLVTTMSAEHYDIEATWLAERDGSLGVKWSDVIRAPDDVLVAVVAATFARPLLAARDVADSIRSVAVILADGPVSPLEHWGNSGQRFEFTPSALDTLFGEPVTRPRYQPPD